MIKKLLLTLMLMGCVAAISFAQGTLRGKVTDQESKELLYDATVKILKGGVFKKGAKTDFDGVYSIDLDPGDYDIEVSYLGYQTLKINGLTVENNKIRDYNIKLAQDGVVMEVVEIVATKELIKTDGTASGNLFTAKEIEKLPTRDVATIVGISAGVTTGVDGGNINIKGGRSEQTAYIVDGVRIRGTGTNSLPVSAIEQIEVITGGLEAQYGDFTGGGIVISTKSIASKPTGSIDAETSTFLNNYGYNFLEGSFGAPLLKKTRKDKFGGDYQDPVLGFRLSGTYRANADPSPPAVPIYAVKKDVAERLKQNPVSYIGGGTPVAAAELLKSGDFDQLKIRPEATYRQLDLTGKVVAKITKTMELSVLGNYYSIRDQNTPEDGSSRSWQAFNSEFNPTNKNDRWRVNTRLRQRFENDRVDSTRKGLTIGSASYELIVGYEQGKRNYQDAQHGDRAFEYGHVGNFNYTPRPIFGQDTAGFVHVGYLKDFKGYNASNFNPILSNYNLGADIANQQFNVVNGLINENVRSVWDYHQNIGRVFDQILNTDNRQLTGTANFALKLFPNGKKAKAHNVKFGFTYEQQTNRSYTIRPFGLWQLADRQQDRQLNGIDTARVVRDSIIGGQSVKVYDYLLRDDLASLADIKFYKTYRDKFFGGNLRTLGNVQNLNPSDLSLDMFSAQELNDAQLLDYYGYDYLGNPLGTTVSFDDFFTTKDAQGVRTFPVAPLQPIYMAGYVQDKFTYKDIIFNIGFRVDRYDANTKVLKDPYSLYEIIGAKDYFAKTGGTKPASVEDDFKVYTNRDRTRISAFRKGDTWYNEQGNPTSPILLFGEGGKPTPYYAQDTFAEIKERGFDPKNSFQDYTPQINIMPRLAFSFPISKGDGENVANFFAHYDVMTSRPSTGTNVTALDYYYFDDQGRTPTENANLRPERTIDYEVGFQQALTKYSALKLAAFYREYRDMIQRRFFKFLPGQVSEYESFDNIDFGTVKGFTAQYEMRGGSNFSANLNYTLQFADGTGSDANSQRDINRRQNIRSLSPLTYDERHRFAMNFDYRYGKSAGKYQVPKLFGSKFLERLGLNVQMFTVSGRPYTARSIPRPFGGDGIAGLLNGSRLPWVFNMDLRLDKTFTIVKGVENKRNPLDLTVYFRAQNVLNIQNYISVYSATGSPSDDGYLASVRGQGDLTNLRNSRPLDVESYLFSYQMRMLDPDFISQPRRMYVGLSFAF